MSCRFRGGARAIDRALAIVFVAALAGVSFVVADELPTTIQVPGYTFDPLKEGPPTLAREVAEIGSDGPRLHLVQFNGPARDEWLRRLEAQGLKVLQYYPHNAFLVWGPAATVPSSAQMSFVRWQGRFESAYKVDGGLARRAAQATAARGTINNVDVMFYNDGRVEDTLAAIQRLGGKVLRHHPSQPDKKFYDAIVQIDGAALSALAQIPTVVWSGYSSPTAGLDDEMADQIVAGNHPNGQPITGYRDFLATLGFDGTGVTWAVIDSGVDWDHPDLAPALIGGHDFPGAACVKPDQPGNDCSGHGTHIAGVIAGRAALGDTDANGFLYGLGVAPGARLFAMNAVASPLHWPPDGGWQELSRIALAGRAVGGNNSWYSDEEGEGVGDGYRASERTHDLMVRDGNFGTTAVAEPFIEVFSAGNEGPAARTLSAPHEAKNIITVGNSRNFRAGNIDTIETSSSRGPTADGRIAPTLSAPGTDVASTRNESGNACDSEIPGTAGWYALCGGTSTAAPHVSGAAAILAQWWRATHVGLTPSPAMVKALLVNGAVDMGTPDIPNGNEGWGRLNIRNSLDPGVARVFDDQTLTFRNVGEHRRWSIRVADPTRPLKVTLAWTDAPGAVGASPALVNNLDLTVEANGKIYRGNGFVGGWSWPNLTADRLNNLENVYIQSPGALAVVTITASALNGDGVPYNADTTDQDYAFVCQNCVVSQQPVVVVRKHGFDPGHCTITSEPAGISCGAQCAAAYSPGTPVTLTATGAFVGWGGVCTGAVPTCTITASSPVSVAAECSRPRQTLTVTRNGAGSGTVTSVPSGINCGSTCTANPLTGTVMTLTASPASGSLFARWSGGCSGATTTCSVTMSAARNVNAAFCRPQSIAPGTIVEGLLAATDCEARREPGSYADRYTFSAVAGGRYTFEMGGTFDTVLYVFNASGTLIAGNDNSGGGTSSRIPAGSGTLLISTAGVYTVEATSVWPAATGQYSFRLTRD